MSATALRSASTTEKCVVSELSAGHSNDSGDETEARSAWIVLRRAAAYSFETRRSTGMPFTTSGSPRKRTRSANARRMASLTVCTKSEELAPNPGTS